MPDDNRTQDQSNGTPLYPPDDLIGPILGRDIPADSRRATAPNALSNIVKADHDALVTDEELLAEARNEMPPSSASRAPTRWMRIWLRQLLVACLLLVATDVLRDQVTAEFVMNEEESQEAREQEEYDRIVSGHDDPIMQTWKLAEHYDKKWQAPEAQRAFADQERLERLQRVDQQSRKLKSITPNNAFIREPVGAVLNVAPDILSIVAWLTGSGEAADELRRQSQEFQQARRKLRQGAQLVFYDDGSKPTGSSPPATPGSSVAQPQPRAEPSAIPQVEDAPPRTPEELLEEFVLASPLMKRALARTRTEELIAAGVDPTKAAEQARQEQAERAATPNNAQVRETVGGALNATPDLAAAVARLTAEKEAADRKRLSAKEVYDNAKNSVVFVTVFDGTNTEPIGAGTGFVVSEDGLIATNFHVIEGAQIATVSFADGRVLTIEGVVGVNRVADLALLKVGGTNLSFLKLGSKELPQVGNDVYALGNPRGLTHTLSPGIVTRESEWTGDSTRIQTNAAISPGSSGGPLLDEYGTVVGITTGFILDSQNLNLAVPVELLARLLAARGEVQSLPSFARSKMDQFEKDSILQLRPDRAKRALAFGVYELGVEAARRADQPNVENSDQLWESAIESLNKAVELDPSFVAPRIVLACIHLHYKNEHDKAKQLLDEAIRREPSNAETHYYLADVHYDEGNEEEAMRELNLAVNLDPYFGPAYRMRSRLYEARNELTEAALDLKLFEALAGNFDADFVYPWTLRSVLFRSKESGLTLQYSSAWYPFESMAEGSELRLIRHDHARAIAFSLIYLGEVFHPGMKREEMVVDLFEGMREAEPSLGNAEIVRLGVGKLIHDRKSVHWLDYEIKSPPLLARRSRIFTLEHAGKVWSIRFSTPRDEVLFRQYLPSAEDVILSISFH